MVLDELLVSLGFDYDPEEMKEFNNDVSSTVDTIKKLTKAAIAGATAITALTVASTKASDDQGKLANELGVSVEEVDALRQALQISGGSADDMTASLRSLSKLAGETARGVGTGVEAFGLLGLSVQDTNGQLKSSTTLLNEISGEFQNLSKQQQVDLADKLGLSGSLRLLQQGPRAIRELTDEAKALGVVTAKDAQVAADFQDSLTRIWVVVKDSSRLIATSLAPAMGEANTQFTEWWKANRDIIAQKLPEWIDNITKGIKLLTIATGAWISLRIIGYLTALVTLFKSLTVVSLAASASALLLPGLIAAGVAGLALLAEDAKMFFEGGDSFIGDMIEQFPEFNKELVATASVFATLAELTGMILTGWASIFDLFRNSSLEGLKDFGSNLPGFLGDLTGLAPVGGGGILSGVGDTVSNAATTVVDKVEIVVQGGADTAENIANAVYNVFQQTSQDLNTTVDQ